jgi:transcriptional regulator with XRE-family HTH domain
VEPNREKRANLMVADYEIDPFRSRADPLVDIELIHAKHGAGAMGATARPAEAGVAQSQDRSGDGVSDSAAGTWDTFGAYLRNQRQLAQLSLRQLAALTQVSNPYLSQIERGLHQPSIGVVKSLAEALNLSVGDMLAHAADIMSDDEASTSTEAAIRNDSRLDNSQKSALLAVLASMVASSTTQGPDGGAS